MNELIIYSGILLFGTFVSSLSQLFLKKSADIKYNKWWKEYLNVKVIFSYIIFIFATLCSVYAYKVVPLSFGPVLGSFEYIFVAILSFIFLKEKISKKKLIGLILIIVGVLIFSIK